MATSNVRIEFRTYATTYGLGPYHPAIRDEAGLMYWPNVTYPNETDAYHFAAQALKRAYDAANDVAGEWNITQA